MISIKAVLNRLKRSRPHPLAEEMKTYEACREELLRLVEGKFVLIKEKDVLGAFDSCDDVVTYGYEHLGNVPFLVKQVLRVEVPISILATYHDEWEDKAMKGEIFETEEEFEAKLFGRSLI